MIYNEFGKTGMRVSNLSFGTTPLSEVFRDIREAKGIKAAHAAVENGINFIDVSPYYNYYKAKQCRQSARKHSMRQILNFHKDGTLSRRREKFVGIFEKAHNERRLRMYGERTPARYSASSQKCSPRLITSHSYNLSKETNKIKARLLFPYRNFSKYYRYIKEIPTTARVEDVSKADT